MIRIGMLAAVVASLVACAIKEENLPEAYGRAACSKYRQCEKAEYEDNYSEFSDCVDDQADVVEFLSDAADLVNQEYNAKEAGECVRAVRGMSCDDWGDELPPECDNVWG